MRLQVDVGLLLTKETVDWWDLPQFRFAPVDVSENAQRALMDVSLLFVMNLVLFMVSFLIFIKVEV